MTKRTVTATGVITSIISLAFATSVFASFTTPTSINPLGNFYYHQMPPADQTPSSNLEPPPFAVFILGGGPGFSSWNLEPVQASIADLGHPTYLMDMLGIGENRSQKPVQQPIHTSSQQPVRLLDSWIKQIAQLKTATSPDRPVILVAHSWGALMAMLYTRQYPESVEKIILLNPVDPQKKAMAQLTDEIHERNNREIKAQWDNEQAWENVTEFNEADLETVTLRQIQQVLPTYFLDYEQGKRYANQFTIKDFNIDLNIQAWKEYDETPILFSEINKWQKPLHFLECKQDYLMPYNLNAMQPNINLTSVDLIDQCGHFPWIEQPNIFNRLLAGYLGRSL